MWNDFYSKMLVTFKYKLVRSQSRFLSEIVRFEKGNLKRYDRA